MMDEKDKNASFFLFHFSISQLEINGRIVSVISEAVGGTNVDNCPHACIKKPCGPFAQCIPNMDNYECQCSPLNVQCNKAEELTSQQIDALRLNQRMQSTSTTKLTMATATPLVPFNDVSTNNVRTTIHLVERLQQTTKDAVVTQAAASSTKPMVDATTTSNNNNNYYYDNYNGENMATEKVNIDYDDNADDANDANDASDDGEVDDTDDDVDTDYDNDNVNYNDEYYYNESNQSTKNDDDDGTDDEIDKMKRGEGIVFRIIKRSN